MHDRGNHQPNRKGNTQADDAKYRRNFRWLTLLFGVFGVIIIPIYTIRFASNASLTESNMSIIGNSMDKLSEFILWGVLTVGFFMTAFSFLFLLTGFENKRANRLLRVACGLLILTVLIPFLPDQYPTLAFFHNLFAMAAPLIAIVVMLMFVLYLGQCDPSVFRKAIIFLVISVTISAALVLTTGTSGLVEVVFVVSMCALLFNILIWLLRSDKVDLLTPYEEAERTRKARQTEKRRRARED